MREAQLVWELAENLHRLDLTKDQRDQHIRRYAELLEIRQAIPQQNAAELPVRGPGQPKGIPRRIAEETGLSVDTVRRALNPPEPKNPLPDHDVVTVQFNSLVAAWNRAGREARAMPRCWRRGALNPDNLSKFLVGAGGSNSSAAKCGSGNWLRQTDAARKIGQRDRL